MQFWYDLNVAGSSFGGPWLCCGDFNSIFNQSEKWGGRQFGSTSSMTDLNRFL